MKLIYNQLLTKYNLGDPRCLGWSSLHTQQQRFEAIEYFDITNAKSILDIGSGFGDFYTFLNKRGYEGNYVGIENMIEFHTFSKQYLPSVDFILGDFLNYEFNEKFDYVVASGFFWLSHENWQKEFEQSLHKMFTIAEKGVAFNLLSPLTHKFTKGLKYVDFKNAINEIIKLTPFFCIKHDYHKDARDYTCFLFKP